MCTAVNEVVAEQLNLTSRAGNYNNEGMTQPLAESDIQKKSHVCYEVKYLGLRHKEDPCIMFSLCQKSFS